MLEELDPPEVVFRPSYSATTLYCPGSLRPSMDAPDTAGYDAAVGTVFHDILAIWQKVGVRPHYMVGLTRTIKQPRSGAKHHVVIDEDMFVYGQQCIDHYADIPGKRYVEVRVDISSLTPIAGQSGTADLIICQPHILTVIDWKYGTGVQVFAEHNTQGLCYAWGAFQRYDDEYDFKTIRIHIAQPRLNHWDVWEISRAQLYEFADWARNQWALGWSGNADRVPSPKACQWCRVKAPCPARQAQLQAIANDSFDILDEVSLSPTQQQEVVGADHPKISLTSPAELSTERLAWIYRYRKSMEQWFKAIGEELLERGLQGEDLGGLYKVGQGRQGNREWADEEKAAAALTRLGIDPEALWSRTLVSPKTVEGLLRAVNVKGKLNKEYIDVFTTRTPGKLTLMPVKDNRLGLEEIVEQSFEEIE